MTADLSVIGPEIFLALFAMAALLGAVYTKKDALGPLLLWVTAGVFIFVAFWIGLLGEGRQVAFSGMYVDDAFSRFAKIAVLLSAAVVLVMGESYMHRRGLLRFEFPILIVFAVIGMMVMVSAGDLMALYMGLELQSLALYVIASLRRDSEMSTEAGLKYFALGALSSGLLLFGASLVYGFTGTTLFSGIYQVASNEPSLGLLVGLVFLMSGFAFKVSAVPFHMWTPDVYEGAPTPITAFFASAPKIAAMVLFARVMHDAFGGNVSEWQQIVALLAIASMLLGAVAAIGQTNIKRLLAYSSIAHMGYALMGLASGTAIGVQAMLFYMAIYAFMTIGTFAFVLLMERDGVPVVTIESLKGYSAVSPARALAFFVLLFSLAGVPPMLGFFAKLEVLRAAVDAGLYWLAVGAVIASVIGAYYYLRLIYFMYFAQSADEPLEIEKAPVLYTVLVASAVAMVIGAVSVFGLGDAAALAADALVN